MAWPLEALNMASSCNVMMDIDNDLPLHQGCLCNVHANW